MSSHSIIVAGLGNRGQELVAAASRIPGLVLAGIADHDSSRRLPNVPFFSSVEEACREARPDLLVLALPLAARAPVAIERILGAHAPRVLLVEKPLALAAVEAEAIRAVCLAQGTRLVVGHQMRFAPEFKALRDYVASGRLGTVTAINASSVGNLVNQGAHLIDLAGWLSGGMDARLVSAVIENDSKVLAASRPFGPSDLGDIAHPAPLWMSLGWKLQSGVRLDVEAGHLAPAPLAHLGPWLQKRLVVEGTEGRAEAHVAAYFRSWAADGSLTTEVPSSLAAYNQATEVMLAAVASGLDGTWTDDLADGTSAVAVSARIEEALAKTGALEDRTAQLPKAAAAGPRVSVLLPLADHRGLAERAVSSWTREQDGVAAADFELVVLISDSTPELSPSRIRALLRSEDRLIVVDRSSGELEDYHLAAKEARGEWLVMTEAHCIAEPDAIAEILRHIDRGEDDGFCAATLDLSASPLARAEARMYDRGFAEWCRPGDWRKVILRLFAIRRRDYEEAGGFRYRYGRFSEWLLAADLKRRGFRLGYASKVRIHHTYCDYFAELDPFIRTFTDGECLYRHEHRHEAADPYFPVPPEWEEMQTAAGAAAVTRCLVRLGPEGWKRLLPHLAASPDTLALRLGLKRLWARLMTKVAIAIGKDESTLDHWFVRAYEMETFTCRVRFAASVAKGASEPPVAASRRLNVGEAPASELFGFHPREEVAGRPFRWASPLAAIRLSMPAEGGILYLDTHPFLPPAAEEGTRVAFGGTLLKSLPPEGGRLRFSIPAGSGGEGWFVILASQFPAPGDIRKLGLPIAAAGVEAA